MTPRTILIADDDRLVRESLSDLLSSLGCTTRQAGNGGGAIALLTSMPCDLLLSDVDMPDMSGFQLLSWVHQHQLATSATGFQLPVVLMSARADEQLGHAARQAGARALLPKPVEISRIANLVHQLFGH